jgi:tRNA (guanine37-N1)-methyltransferase
MKISILTLFPGMLHGFLNESILKRAQEKKLVEIELVNVRDYAVDKYGTVDDKPYGGGVGMVMRVDCIHNALEKTIGKEPVQRERIRRPLTFSEMFAQKKKKLAPIHTVLTSAKGGSYTQEKAKAYADVDHLVIIAGHYEGVDARILEYVDEEISGGDFILTGGEIIAATIADSVVRLIPGVLKHSQATEEESFFEADIEELIQLLGKQYELVRLQQRGREKVQLLEYPQYTRPEEFRLRNVPDVLLSGNHRDIYNWRLEHAYKETLERRPDLLQ